MEFPVGTLSVYSRGSLYKRWGYRVSSRYSHLFYSGAPYTRDGVMEVPVGIRTSYRVRTRTSHKFQ